ncbi:MAG TPA: hypothetical protein VMA36_20545, partial [Candidatus Limnocylindria bacterium]|nr:hypothetical protein [Candidatus Limnocylindria bacterium]
VMLSLSKHGAFVRQVMLSLSKHGVLRFDKLSVTGRFDKLSVTGRFDKLSVTGTLRQAQRDGGGFGGSA